MSEGLGKNRNLNERLRILIADDHNALRDTIKDVIEEKLPKYLSLVTGKADLSIEVSSVSDGTHALEELKKAREESKSYGIILTDNNMPVMGGYELIKEYVEHSGDGTKFVMMTGDNLSEKEISYLKDLQIPVLYKPFEPDDILNIITTIYKQKNEGIEH